MIFNTKINKNTNYTHTLSKSSIQMISDTKYHNQCSQVGDILACHIIKLFDIVMWYHTNFGKSKFSILKSIKNVQFPIGSYSLAARIASTTIICALSN
jgi:hypothetical protein